MTNYPHCPINTNLKERSYYLAEVKRVSTKIKDCYLRMNPKGEKNGKCKASDIKRHLNCTDGFYLIPAPGHTKDTMEAWLSCLFNMSLESNRYQ